MKATYFVALFALFAVANAYGNGVEDSKTQYQSADGTQGQLTNSEGLVNADNALAGAVNVASKKEGNAEVEQQQDME